MSAKNILLLSDTHGYIDQQMLKYVSVADEVWHAGDLGSFEVSSQIEAHTLLRGVYGNIDDHDMRSYFPKTNLFSVEGVKVFMIHIGGYPNRYAPGVRDMLKQVSPNVFISGHSHILKVIQDPVLNLLHLNPGAAGFYGHHHVRTMLRFTVSNAQISNMEVIEMLPRHPLKS